MEFISVFKVGARAGWVCKTYLLVSYGHAVRRLYSTCGSTTERIIGCSVRILLQTVETQIGAGRRRTPLLQGIWLPKELYVNIIVSLRIRSDSFVYRRPYEVLRRITDSREGSTAAIVFIF